MSQWVRWGLRLAGLALAVGIYLRIDIQGVVRTLAEIDPVLCFVAVILAFSATFIRAYKWHLFLKLVGRPVRLADTFRLHLIGVFLGMVTPGRVGELAKFTYMRKQDGSISGRTFVSVALDRGFDLIGLVMLGALLLATFLIAPAGQAVALRTMLWICLLLSTLFAVLWLFRLALIRLAVRVVELIRLRKLTPYISEMHGLMSNISAVDMLKLLGASLLSWTVITIDFVVVAWSLNIELPAIAIALSACVAAVAAILPVSIGGLGTREAALIYVFGLLGSTAGEAVALAIVIFALNVLIAQVGFLCYWDGRKITLKTNAPDTALAKKSS